MRSSVLKGLEVETTAVCAFAAASGREWESSDCCFGLVVVGLDPVSGRCSLASITRWKTWGFCSLPACVLFEAQWSKSKVGVVQKMRALLLFPSNLWRGDMALEWSGAHSLNT